MKKIEVHIDFGSKSYKVGGLYASEEMGRHAFGYDPAFIASGLQISPLMMPLSANTYTARRNPDMYDLHGVFADSLPDDWGRKVQDAEFMKLGIFEPTALDRLAFIGNNGIGALHYVPAREFEKGEEVVKLADLRKATQQIIAGGAEEVSEALLKSGGSAGGQRPKFLLDMNVSKANELRYHRGRTEKGFIPVILKVPVRGQDHYIRIEYAYAQIARDMGMRIPEHFLIIGEKNRLAHFALKRFDILDNGDRMHAHTLAGIMGINFRETTPDCSMFLRIIDDITLNHEEVTEGFRRVVFNYIGSNKDDHAKNFSFLMNGKGEWSLSPAYDIGFSKGQNDLHLMRLNDKFRNAELRDFQKLAGDFDIANWKHIVEQSVEAFKKWPSLAKDFGITEKYSRMVGEKISANINRLG